MRYSTIVSLAALAGSSVVSALPRGRRDAAAAADPNDVLVLRFAEALQHLEGEFYNQSLSKFQDSDISAAGFSAPTLVVQQLSSIAQDESTHAAVLDAVLGTLGSSPISGCTFNFSSVLGSVDSVAATARLVENVGVGAYLGAAQLLKSPSILSAAGTILTVEARHQTVLNMLSGNGTTIPSAFDLALLPTEVLAIAGGFVGGCDLGVGAPNPALAVTNTDLSVGTQLQFSSAAINGTIDPNTMSCSMLVGGAGFSMVQPFNNCMVPQGMNGPVLVYVTSDDNPIAGNPAIRAQNKIVAGPTMLFIDTVPQAIPQLVRSGAASSGSSSDSSSASSSDTASSTSSSDSSSQTASSTDSSSDASSTSSSDASSSTSS